MESLGSEVPRVGVPKNSASPRRLVTDDVTAEQLRTQ